MPGDGCREFFAFARAIAFRLQSVVPCARLIGFLLLVRHQLLLCSLTNKALFWSCYTCIHVSAFQDRFCFGLDCSHGFVFHSLVFLGQTGLFGTSCSSCGHILCR